MSTSQNNVVWYNRADSALAVWAQGFSENVSLYETDLEVDAGELEEIQDASEAYITALSALNTARAAYLAAVEAKDAARASMIETDRRYVAQFQALPNLDPKILLALDVPQRKTAGSRSAAITPTNPVANAFPNGDVVIRFGRNGNSSSTVFTVERSRDLGETWTSVFSSARTRVKLSGYTPGETVWFRVFATRNGTVSAPTVPAMIWPDTPSGETELELAA